METAIAEKWLLEMESELALLDESQASPVERLRQAIPVINRFINDLKNLVLEKGFPSEAAEVDFFKHIKPRFYAHHIYEVLLYNLRMQKPEGTVEMIKDYYEAELLHTFREFRVQGFAYAYFKNNLTELDKVYFTRGGDPGSLPVLEWIDPIPGFSTAMDYTFAKFIAYERLRDYLLDKLTGISVAGRISSPKSNTAKTLRWTGEAINLVELAYGIWLTKQFNDGNATITEIISWLELNLQVKMGVPYRKWAAIAARKRISVTKFTDQMKAAILKRIDDENGL